MIVGEAWGADEEHFGEPFVGSSGQELNRMLHEAGIMRSECFVSNLVNARPPNNDLEAWIPKRKSDINGSHVALLDKMVLPIVLQGWQQLQREIELVNPRVIIACGNYALWALTGKWGIVRWRGSQLEHSSGRRVIPTYHPAAILRQWDWRAIAINDLRRAKRTLDGKEAPKPNWIFEIRPSFSQAISRLDWLISKCDEGPFWVDFDLETKHGHIDCAGFSWSLTEAICIPFMSWSNREGYWTLEEEAHIVWKIYKLLTHKNILVRGQNLLYDSQYTFRRWNFIPRVAQDTMISHHVAWAGLPKALDFQSSMYSAYYVQWKPEKGSWKDGG